MERDRDGSNWPAFDPIDITHAMTYTMNYLAHLYVSRQNEELMVGNVLGEFVKGEIDYTYHKTIRRGILMHRKIDSFSAGHPIVKSSRSRISSERRRFADIIIDICFDHFLIKRWPELSETTLPDFINQVHRILKKYQRCFTPEMDFLLSKTVLRRLLSINSTLDGVDFTLKRLSKRFRRKNPLATAVEELQANYDALANDFDLFLPELIAFISEFESLEEIPV